MVTTNKQSGFAKIGIIITAVLVIGVLGFFGWSFLNQPTKKAANAAPNNQSSASQPVKAYTTATQNSYLDIKEFGIKIPLDNSIADTTYILDPNLNSNPAEAQTVDITTKSLAAVSKNKCNLFEITRTADQNILGIPLAANGINIFKIGNFYFVLNGTQFLCSTDKSVQHLLFQQSATFAKDFKSEQPDN